MSLGSVVVRLTMDTATFDTDAGRAAKIAEKRAKEIDASFKRAGAAIGVALAAAAVTVTAVTARAITFADSIDELSQRLGISTEALSGWDYAAKLSGTSLDALASAIPKLSKNLAAAMDEGSRMGQLFKTLGVDVKDANGNLRAVDDVLPEIADRFKALDNDTTEAALAMELFGKSGAELLEFLNRGSDGIAELTSRAAALGIVIGSDTAGAAAEFNDKLDDLRAVTMSFGLLLADELLPALTELVDWMVKSGQAGWGLRDSLYLLGDVSGLLVGEIKKSDDVGKSFTQTIMFLRGAVDSLREGLSSLASFDLKGFVGNMLDAQKAASGAVIASFQPFEEQKAPTTRGQRNARGGSNRTETGGRNLAYGRELETSVNRFFGGSDKPKKAGGGKSEAQREAEQLDASYQRLKDSLNETYALFDQNTEAAKILYDTQNGELAKLSEARKQELVLLAERNDAQKLAKELQDAADKAAEGESKRVREAIKDNEAVLAFMREDYELMGMSNKEREREFALRQLNKDATDEQIEAVKRQADANYELAESLAFADDVKAGLSDMFVDFVSGAKSAKDAFADFSDMIFKRALQFLADKAVQAMFDAFSGTGSGGMSQGTPAGKTESGLSGLFSLFFGGGMASGGTARANTMYEVNERGFEMATVGGRDYMLTGNNPVQITPNHRLGGASNTQNNQFVFAAPTSPKTQTQIAARLSYEQSRARRLGV